MTGNPHPEHGPLWVAESPTPGGFQLWFGTKSGDNVTLTDHLRPAIEAQLTPLPDGVYVMNGATWIAADCPLPAGEWQWLAGGEWITSDGSYRACNRLVRRTPAEPPAPPTEDVPWWESVGRKLGKGPERGNVIRRCGKNGDHAWVNTHRDRHATDVPDGVNPDGTVTVQRETGA